MLFDDILSLIKNPFLHWNQVDFVWNITLMSSDWIIAFSSSVHQIADHLINQRFLQNLCTKTKFVYWCNLGKRWVKYFENFIGKNPFNMCDMIESVMEFQ